MNGDPTTMTSLGGVRSDEATERYLRDNLDHWEHYGFGVWALRGGTNGRFVGRAGLRHTNVSGHEVELARVAASRWRSHAYHNESMRRER